MFWNINGFTELLKSTDATAWLDKNCDICFLSETHLTKGENFNIDGFQCINHPFSDVLATKPRGGVTCMVKHDFMQHIIDIDCDNDDTIILSFHGGHTVFGTYIPPVDSPYYDDSCFTTIPNIFSGNDSSKVVIGGGDLNSRVGNVSHSVPVVSSKYRDNVDKCTWKTLTENLFYV